MYDLRVVPRREIHNEALIRKAKEKAARKIKESSIFMVDLTKKPSSKKNERRLDEALDLAVRWQPSEVIVTVDIKAIDMITEAVEWSGNIKGELTHKIWEAVITLIATNSILDKRALNKDKTGKLNKHQEMETR